MLVPKNNRRRTAAHAVEMAFVTIPLILFFLGIFEFGRYLMFRNLVNNAAREGCRYAIANNTTDAAVNTTVNTLVTNYMAGKTGGSDFSSFTVTLSGVSASTGTSYTGNNVSNLQPGDYISVKIVSTFKFIAPVSVISIPSTAPMNSTCTMLCEGGV